MEKARLERNPSLQEMFDITSSGFRAIKKSIRKDLRKKYKGNNKKLRKKWLSLGHSNIPRDATVNSIETDGVGLSIVIKRPIDPRYPKRHPTEYEVLENPVEAALDTGRAKIFVAAVSTDPLKKPEIVTLTRKRYYYETKHHIRKRWEETRVQQNPALQQALVSLSEENGVLDVETYIQKVSDYSQILVTEYIMDKERALWAMRLYRLKKRSQDLAVRRILVKAGDRPLVIGIGNGKFPSTGKGE